MTKDHTELKHMDKEQDIRTTVVLNELCADGIFRPVKVCPNNVTNVKRLDPPHKLGDYTANTSISYKESDTFDGIGKSGEVFVYEQIAGVLSALGTSIAACEHYVAGLYYAGKYFEEQGIKYSLEHE